MYANGQQVDLFAANDRIRTCTDPEIFPVGGGGGRVNLLCMLFIILPCEFKKFKFSS